MKVLKVRAWLIESKSYIYSSDYKHIRDFFNDIHGLNHITELFTGSKDKNGIDIYDGDLCEYTKSYSSVPEIETVVIYWENRTNGFRAKGNKTNSYGRKSSSIAGSMLRVIGNIHQPYEQDI